MNNPLSLIQAMRNPQAFIQEMMNNSQAMQNPILKNALEMVQKGDKQGVEKLARNLCKEKGVDPEGAIRKIKSQFMKNLDFTGFFNGPLK